MVAKSGDLHHTTASVAIIENWPGDGCTDARITTFPTAVFLLPRIAESVSYSEGIGRRDCGKR